MDNKIELGWWLTDLPGENGRADVADCRKRMCWCLRVACAYRPHRHLPSGRLHGYWVRVDARMGNLPSLPREVAQQEVSAVVFYWLVRKIEIRRLVGANTMQTEWVLTQPHGIKYDDRRQCLVEYESDNTDAKINSVVVICPRGYTYIVRPAHMRMLRALAMPPASNARVRCEQIPQDGMTVFPMRRSDPVQVACVRRRRDLADISATIRVVFTHPVERARIVICEVPALPMYYIRLPNPSADAPEKYIEPACAAKHRELRSYGCIVDGGGELRPLVDGLPESVRGLTANMPITPLGGGVSRGAVQVPAVPAGSDIVFMTVAIG